MIRIQEITGRPIARRMFLQNLIEDLPIDGDESFQKSLIGLRDMLRPSLFNNLNEQGMNCHFQEVLYSAMENLICFFSDPREHELADFLFDLSFEVESKLKNIKPGDIFIPGTYFKFVGTFRSIFGLMGYGGQLDEHHQAASTE